MSPPKIKKKTKDLVRISKRSLLKLLLDNEHFEKQVADLQLRKSELLLEVKILKKALEDTKTALPSFSHLPPFPERTPIIPIDTHPDLGEQIYFDVPYNPMIRY